MFYTIKKRKNLVLSIILILLFALPLFSAFAQEGERLVPCDGPDCGFDDLLEGMNRIISWFITVGTLIATVGFAYVGFIYITQGGNPSKRSEANQIFSTIAKGFFFLLASFLIVKLILSGLGSGEEGQALKFLDL